MKPFSLHQIYQALLKMYGAQMWWPADSSFEMMVGAILTQNTAWTNVEKAIANLKRNRCLTPKKIIETTSHQLADWIKPAGYFNIKTKRLKNYCEWYLKKGGHKKLDRLNTEVLREELLKVNGVGRETADDILLYAFHRPVFVIDAYTRRLLQRLQLIKGIEDYETLRKLYETELAPDVQLYNQYHALIVIHAKERCRKTKPVCAGCALVDICIIQYTDRGFN